jgi:hypothetical protein
MIVTLHSTTKIVELQVGTAWVPARIWEGETQSGIQVHAYITRIAVPPGQDVTQFELELEETAAPSPVIEAIPMRLIL